MQCRNVSFRNFLDAKSYTADGGFLRSLSLKFQVDKSKIAADSARHTNVRRVNVTHLVCKKKIECWRDRYSDSRDATVRSISTENGRKWNSDS